MVVLILVLILVFFNRDFYLIIEFCYLIVLPFGRLLMMDVDDDGFKSTTAFRLNKACGLIKGRAAPCNIEG